MKVARTVLRGAHFRNEVRLPDLAFGANRPTSYTHNRR